MIDKLRLLIKAFNSAQEKVGADAVPPATASEVIDVLGFGGKTASDLLDKAQHDGLISRRWGGFVALSHSGREVGRGPAADADEAGKLEMAVAELATATVFLRRQPLSPQIALDARNLVDETRATVVTLVRSDDESEPVADHLERITKLATRISQNKHADKDLLSATAHLSNVCASIAEITSA
jgi:hypothetical protein